MSVLGDSINRKSKKKTFSINSQIDELEGMEFGDYSKGMDKRFSRLVERQISMMSHMYDQFDSKTDQELRKSFQDRQESMRKSLEDWKDYSDKVREDLSFTEKMATDLFYWNRRRDLRNLEREARYRFDDIADDAEDMTSNLNDMFTGVADNLRSWANALNLNSIANGLSDTTSSMRDLRISLQKNLSLTNDQWSELRDYASEFSAETDYAISNIEYLSNIDAIVKLGVDDTELAKTYAKITTKFEDFTGVAASELESVFSMSKYLDDPEYISKVTSQIMAIQQATGLRTSGEDIVGVYNSQYDLFKSLSNGDKDKLQQYLEQSMKLTTASNAGEYSGLSDKLFEIMGMDSLDLMDSEYKYLNGSGIQKLMRQRDFEGAAQLLIQSVQDKSGMSRDVLGKMGIDTTSDWWASIVSQGNMQEFTSAYGEVSDIIDKQTSAAEKFVDTYEPAATKLEKLSNQFKSSKLGGLIDDISSELDITLAEGMLIASGAIQIGQVLFKGIKGIGKLFGIGGSAAGAAGGLGSTIASGLGSLGSSAVLNLGVLGEGLITAGGGSAAGASVGGLALAGGASIAGGVLGGAS